MPTPPGFIPTKEVFMPIQKSKPSSGAKAAPDKAKKPSELGDDELRRVTGGMTSGGSAGATTPVCVSQT